MAIRTLDQLKTYFRKGLYPTESQFADVLDSYRHKGEKVGLTQIEGLADALNSKYNTSEAKIIEAKQKQQEADIDWLKTVQETQAEDIDELQESDKTQREELETINGELAKVRELIKSGATLDQARDALLALGENYNTLYSLASTVKTFLEATDTKDKTINTWLEVENFLQGITDTASLTALLKELEDKVSEAYTLAIAEALENSGNLLQIDYGSLICLRDSAQLTPGKLYRIIDYDTTVANDQEARSAGHPFDLIVLALSTDTLSEEAMAMRSERDTEDYFSGCNLEAWKVWYCMDNDTNRFQWADTENGRGVIYRMIDEWGNDCPYDFKNIQFKRYHTFGYYVDSVIGDWDPTNTHYILGYSMEGLLDLQIEDYNDYIWLYTFSYMLYLDGSDVRDASLIKTVNKGNRDAYFNWACKYNKMEAYHICDNIDDETNVVQALNNIVLTSYDEKNLDAALLYGNKWDTGCYNMTFHDHCYCNKFGAVCWNIIAFEFHDNCFGNLCSNMLFGCCCKGNTFGPYSGANFFWNNCAWNSLGIYSQDNTFSNGCFWNELGGYANCNYLALGCECNRIGNRSSGNSFGDGCHNNVLGDACFGNEIGSYCTWNALGAYCEQNIFGDECSLNILGSNCIDNTFGTYCVNNTFETSCQSNIFGCRLRNITLGSDVYRTSVPGTDDCSIYVQNAKILGNTRGADDEYLEISFIADTECFQFAGKNSVGELRIWTPADFVP